jgi:precorrin-2/cobalt-factor-2 C20-methyltransferase
MNHSTGTFYGIGVGPGDPELLTLKAVRVINHVDVIFAASSIKNRHSLAVEIARPHISEHADIRMLPFQMSNNEDEKETLWEENARVIMAELEQGKNVAFLTLGDALTYSTYGYLIRIIQQKNPGIPIRSIPGITSYLAAASRMNMPLVEGEESLLITSGARGGKALRKFSGCAENVVLLKTYRNIKDINDALAEAGLLKNSRGVSRCGRAGEKIFEDVTDLEKQKPDYWSLIIAKRNSKKDLEKTRS